MEQQPLITALETLGFQRIEYPSDKYQVFENGSLRYFVDASGALRRGKSVSSSVAAQHEVAALLARAEQTVPTTGEQDQDQDGHHQGHGQAEPQEEQAAEHGTADQPVDSGKHNKPQSKQQILVELLQRPEGATIEQIMFETGWQAHSVRGIISGVLKKKLGLTVTSEKPKGGQRHYRVAAENKSESAV